jgi:hypothetical protein
MNNNLEFQNEDPSPDSIEDNHPRTNYGQGYYEEPKQETLEEAGKRVSKLVDGMDANMEMFNKTGNIDDVGYVVSNIRDIIHEIVKILDVK